MNTFFGIVIVILMIMVVVSLVRGIITFLKNSKQDLESGSGTGPTQNQLLQNKMMFARVKYQAAAVVVVAVLLAMSR
jgi:hypothetical protein